jgi:DNA repair protein SbcC/Rad50
MIEHKEIKNTLNKYYDLVVQPEGLENIFKCERRSNDKPYQYFYFDFSGKVEKKDIYEYSRELLHKDYYNNPGYLQWNFYLAFLVDKKVSEEIKKSVEQNEDFARKFLVEIDNLDDWLDRIYNVDRLDKKSLKRNLGDIWREQFRLKKLDCIYSDEIKDNEAIEGIIKGSNLRDNEIAPQNNHVERSEIELGKILELDAKNFRDHLNFDDPFSFSDVNLIHGKNGMGKTSLLEAIEYFVTGTNFREEIGRKGSNSKNVKALLEGRNSFISATTSYEVLRERDKEWYNSVANIRGSQLYKSFNRFNFFNTDAAFRLSHEDKSIESVEKSLKEIALGDDVNYLKREIQRYQEKLERKKRERESKKDSYEEELAEIKKSLKELADFEGASDKFYAELKSELKKNNWLTKIPSKDELDIEKLSINVTKIKSFFESLLEDLDWTSQQTINGLISQKEDIRKILELIGSNLSFSDEIVETITNQKRVNEKIDKLKRLKEYFENELLVLIGIEEEISRQKSKIKLLEVQNERFIKIDKDDFLNESEKTSIRLKYLSDTLSTKKEEYGSLIRQIKELKDGISELEELSSLLNANGSDYIKKSNTKACPLCNHVYSSNKELLERIKKTTVSLNSSELLSKLLSQQKNLSEEIELIKNKINKLTELDDIAIKLLTDEEYQDISSVSDMVTKLIQQFEKIEDEKSHLKRLLTIREKASKERFSEDELNDLKAFFTSNFKESFEKININSILEDLIAEKKKLEIAIKDLETKIEEKEKEIKRIIKKYDLKSNDQTYLENRKGQLEHYLSEIEEVRKKIKFNDSENLLKIKQRALDIDECLEKLRLELERESKTNHQFKKSEERVNNIKPIIDKLNNEIDRISKALSDISEVITDHSEDEFLSGFYSENLNTITKIFLAIHSPNEFSGIDFDSGKLSIIRADTGKALDINSISTGQRSALALSIFLTLNSKLNDEPKFIILDDPIAFIDDLNVLSFLDYLREIALSNKKNKQIFFATANDDLAFLFKKKFDVLGDGFKEIVLER